VPEHDRSDDPALRRLEADGLVRRSAGGWRTTRRFQSAMARAAARLLLEDGSSQKREKDGAHEQGSDDATGGDPFDLREPIVAALIGLYGECAPDALLVDMVAALLPIEARELAPSPTDDRRPP
jgi:hypothetical protein